MRWMVKLATVGSVVVLSVAPALAADCPALIKKIADETGNRFDDAAYQAKQKAAAAEALQKQGKAVPVDVPKRVGESQLGVYEGLDGDPDDDLRGHR